MEDLIIYITVGFIAQLIDGSLGMAYGLSASTFLLSLGLPPAVASGCVHISEVFTTGVSGFSHWKLGNVNWGFVTKLALPGVIGGLIGVYVLTSIDGNTLKPFIALYLLCTGIFVLAKVIFRRTSVEPREVKHLSILGLFGGICDAVGGGGWGPIVTTTLVGRGSNPRETIGSVNFTEFFVTIVQAVAFITLLTHLPSTVIIGLLIGGVFAAPLGAFIVRIVPSHGLMASIGVLIVFISTRTICLSFGLPFLF